MKINVIRGTHQFGGNAVKVTSDSGSAIVLDFGAEFAVNGGRAIAADGITRGKPGVLGVLISHSHKDHAGLIHTILPGVPVYMDRIAGNIYRTYSEVTGRPEAVAAGKMKALPPLGAKIAFGDITVTPFLSDHGTYRSEMFLVEADGKRLLYTGDFRLHGLLRSELLSGLEPLRGGVDLLITEATCAGRAEEYSTYVPSERTLEKSVLEFLGKSPVILFCSIINIDRIAGLSGLVRDRGGRVFVSWAEKRVIDEAAADDAPPAAFYSNLSIPETYDSSLFSDVRAGDLIFTSSFEDFRILSGMIPSAELVFTEWPGNLAHMNSAFCCRFTPQARRSALSSLRDSECSRFRTERTSLSEVGLEAQPGLPCLLDSKNSCRILPHSSAMTPPVMSLKRWFTRGLPAMVKTEPQDPVLGSAAPNTIRSTLECTSAPAHM